MLNKRSKSGQQEPCLVPDLVGKDFSFSALSMMLALGLALMAFIVWQYVPSVPTSLRVFIINAKSYETQL